VPRENGQNTSKIKEPYSRGYFLYYWGKANIMDYLEFVVWLFGALFLVCLTLFEEYADITIYQFYFLYLVHYIMFSLFLFYQEKFIKI
jgi:hypothetical protein